MSSVLVTGGTGFIGSWVTRRLVDQGIRVVTYSRHPDTTLLKDIVGKFDCVTGDVLDLSSLIHTIRYYKVERVIHMSSLLINSLEANPFLGYRVNIDGALNVLEASKLMNVKRFVYVSSKAVYDRAQGKYAHPTYKSIDEEYPKVPGTVYGATKLFMEHVGLSYNRIYGLDFVALRFATTWGPGKLARHAFSTHSKIIESAMLGRSLSIAQGGDQKDDMIYTKDIGNGIVLACFAENLEHRIFHLGTGKGETLQHLIKIVDRIFGGIPIKIGPGLEISSCGLCFIFNIDRARKELRYNPQYNLDRGVKDYIETMRRLEINPLAPT